MAQELYRGKEADMTIDMTKIWFVDGQIIEEQIPEEAIYEPNWGIEYCKSYAEQLRDKTRANRAEHAAECIEYLLSLVQKKWQGLTDEEIRNEANHHVFDESFFNGAVWARGKIKEKNRG